MICERCRAIAHPRRAHGYREVTLPSGIRCWLCPACVREMEAWIYGEERVHEPEQDQEDRGRAVGADRY